MNLLKTNEFMDKTKMKLRNAKTKAFGLASVLALALPQVAQAAGDVASIVKGACEVVVDIFPFIGAFFVISGVFKLILAYRNDQPESQTAAAKDIVIGAVFIAFKVFVWGTLSGLIF